MTPRVTQLLPAAHAGDATGDAARYLRRRLRDSGYEAEIYALTIDDELAGDVHSVADWPPPRDGDLTLLHFAIPSPLSAALLEAGGRRGLVYHNLTPPEMLAPYCPDVATLTARGRAELEMLGGSGQLEVAIGVSDFNCQDLRDAGFAHPVTLPLPLDLERYDIAADPVVTAQNAAAPTTFLTVGRIAPNKRLELFLRAAAYYLAHIDPAARFVILGGGRGLEAYVDALAELARELGLDSRLRWPGRVPHADLVGWYRAADVYVCTSEHEGFCAPLLEAMHFEVPVLARHAAAIPETLGDAGITFDDDDPAALAEMMATLTTDTALRSQLQERGRRRVERFAPARVGSRWLRYVEQTLGAA